MSLLHCLLAETPRVLQEFPVQSSSECRACMDDLDVSIANGQVGHRMQLRLDKHEYSSVLA